MKIAEVAHAVARLPVLSSTLSFTPSELRDFLVDELANSDSELPPEEGRHGARHAMVPFFAADPGQRPTASLERMPNSFERENQGLQGIDASRASNAIFAQADNLKLACPFLFVFVLLRFTNLDLHDSRRRRLTKRSGRDAAQFALRRSFGHNVTPLKLPPTPILAGHLAGKLKCPTSGPETGAAKRTTEPLPSLFSRGARIKAAIERAAWRPSSQIIKFYSRVDPAAGFVAQHLAFVEVALNQIGQRLAAIVKHAVIAAH